MNHKCRVCGAEGDWTPITAHENMFGTGEQFQYVECAECWCVQIARVPEDLGRHYPKQYYAHLLRDEPPPAGRFKQAFIGAYTSASLRGASPIWREFVTKVLPRPGDLIEFGQYLLSSGVTKLSDPILDVGCGTSPYRLAAFKRLGFINLVGIDPFIAGDTVYNGVPVWKRSLESEHGRYRFIMFHHSLEHVPDPIDTLCSAVKSLDANGTLLIRVPVVGTYFWRRFGVNWAELDAPRHLHLFSPESIRVMARRVGLKVLHSTFDSEAWELSSSIDFEARQSPTNRAAEGNHWTEGDRKLHRELVADLNKLGPD